MSTHRANRHNSRGGIQKRATSSINVDKDGDLVMNAANRQGRKANRDSRKNRSEGSSGSGSISNERSSKQLDSQSRRRPARAARPSLHATVLKKAALKDAVVRDGSSLPLGLRTRPKAGSGGVDLVDIEILGLEKSTAFGNKDRGVHDLIAFVERKATNPDAPSREAVRIRKSRMNGNTLIVSVPPDQVAKIIRINGLNFAGTSVVVRLLAQSKEEESSATSSTIDVLREFLSRRYEPQSKFLDLSRLGSDQSLVGLGVFESKSTESKFFPALMKVCDSVFKSKEEKEQTVMSVSLANNALVDVSSVTSLAQTFPALKNLDLSCNKLRDLKALDAWRWKFRQLQQLILSDNPLSISDSTVSATLLRWYPVLFMLNGVRVRTAEELSATVGLTLPISLQPPLFEDASDVGKSFVTRFFTAFDHNRTELIASFYDDQSTFSLCYNSASLLDPLDSSIGSKASWNLYQDSNRNLTKLTHLPAQMARTITGARAIQAKFNSLPITKHPDLLQESDKWCIECHTLPGVPDAARQATEGVGGLLLTIHGVFTEMQLSSPSVPHTLRSFDRTFVLGPGGPARPIRVISDHLLLRPYGGSAAWSMQGPVGALEPSSSITQGNVASQTAIGEHQQQNKEKLVLELCKRTGMNTQYSMMCLEPSGWDMNAALAAFDKVKPSLPAEAFAQR